jgi:hypothetical protein
MFSPVALVLIGFVMSLATLTGTFLVHETVIAHGKRRAAL